jgi:flagellar biosynthetic protein FlhB
MAEANDDKKHLPTERRRRQAREEGQVPKSQDLTSAALLLSAMAVLWWFGGELAEHLAGDLIAAFSTSRLTLGDSQDAANWLLLGAGRWAIASVPFLLAMFLTGVVASVSQTGLVFSTKKLVPNLELLNPVSGLRRILSLQGFARLGFGLFKIAVITGIAIISLRRDLDLIAELSTLEVPQIAKALFDTVMRTTVAVGAALLALAIPEYIFQWWKHERDLMMSDQEIRDELKETEGDPQVSARRRIVQRQLMMRRTEIDVPKADVVVSNPTELAIAIQYDPLTMPAPVVLAKGAGPLAQKIRRIALQHGIPVVERKPLAQVLYKSVEAGSVIPVEQYQAVAEVLRYIYQLQGKPLPRPVARERKVEREPLTRFSPRV